MMMEEWVNDPNDEITIVTTRAGLQRLVESAWHDSAVETGRRVFERAWSAAANVQGYAGDGPFRTGAWTHPFVEDGIERERVCTIVIDENARLLAMTIRRDGKERDPTREEMKDVEASLDDNDVASDPESFDLEQSDLPGWARDQIVDRIAAADMGITVETTV